MARVPGTAVYLYAKPYAVPPMLVTNIRYHGVLHQRAILLCGPGQGDELPELLDAATGSYNFV